MQCTVCPQQVLDNTRMCYLHYKYLRGLTGPSFETAYDLLYAKETFFKEWDEKVGTKLDITVSDLTREILSDDTEVQALRMRIDDELHSESIPLDKYDPLLKKLSNKYSTLTGREFNSLYHDGWIFLRELCKSDQTDMEPKQITIWVQSRLNGFFQNSMVRNYAVPIDDAAQLDDIVTETPTQEDLLMQQELMFEAERIVEELPTELNDRQMQVFYLEYLRGETMTQVDLAQKLGVNRLTIFRDQRLIKRLLAKKGRLYDRTKDVQLLPDEGSTVTT